MNSKAPRRALEIVLLAAVYFLAARLGLLLAFKFKNVSPVWPPSGVALAGLLLFQIRAWPGITLGAFLANYSTGLPLETSGVIAIGNTLEGIVCAALLRRSPWFDVPLTRVQDVIQVILAAAASSVIAAGVGVAGLSLAGLISVETYLQACSTWWLGDAMGVIVFGSALLTWLPVPGRGSNYAGTVSAWKLVEVCLLATCLILTTLYVFGIGRAYPYAVFPVLIWAALRFGQRVTTIAVLFVTAFSVWATVHGEGPFVTSDPERSLVYLQTFMFVVSVTTLLMAASILERKHTEDTLRETERRFMMALEQSDITVYTQDRDLRYTWIYDGKHRFKPESVLGKSDAELASPADASRLAEIKRRVMETGLGERRRVTVDVEGDKKEFDLLVEPVRGASGRIEGVSGVATDITEIGQYQRKVEALNERLKHAMRETHHRVKNNLQVIAAMVDMRLQEGSPMIPSEELRKLAVHTRTLAAVHDLLTQEAEDDQPVHAVSAKSLIEQLVPTLEVTELGRNIQLEVEDLYLPSRQATSIAIIVCELAINAIKHGSDKLCIALRQDHGVTVLEVSDNGTGFPEGFDLESSAGTGLELVTTLCRWDLGGEVICGNLPSGGAKVTVTTAPEST